jgi:hypothetical protein
VKRFPECEVCSWALCLPCPCKRAHCALVTGVPYCPRCEKQKLDKWLTAHPISVCNAHLEKELKGNGRRVDELSCPENSSHKGKVCAACGVCSGCSVENSNTAAEYHRKESMRSAEVPRLTSDEWNEILAGFIAWATVLRRRYSREECSSCHVTYHPSDGPPPKEDEREGSWCGHAHFREMWGYWDEEAQDYLD